MWVQPAWRLGGILCYRSIMVPSSPGLWRNGEEAEVFAQAARLPGDPSLCLLRRLLCFLYDMAANPAAARAPAERVVPAERATADAILAPILGESALQAADLPARGASLRVYRSFPL